MTPCEGGKPLWRSTPDALKAAAGAFSDPQHVEEDNWEWIAVESKHRLRPGMFVAQVVGKSMEPAIPDGDSWRHAKITLKAVNPDIQPIVLTGAVEGQYQVIAEMVEVVGGG